MARFGNEGVDVKLVPLGSVRATRVVLEASWMIVCPRVAPMETSSRRLNLDPLASGAIDEPRPLLASKSMQMRFLTDFLSESRRLQFWSFRRLNCERLLGV